VVPERFGCCHSSDQARGVIASFVRRPFGWTSLRGVAKIRKAALVAVLGGATRADSFAGGGMAAAENAWGASGGQGLSKGPVAACVVDGPLACRGSSTVIRGKRVVCD